MKSGHRIGHNITATGLTSICRRLPTTVAFPADAVDVHAFAVPTAEVDVPCFLLGSGHSANRREQGKAYGSIISFRGTGK